MKTKTNRTASYKGRTYRLEYLGATKFGRRAKLAFLDGSKEFWVDASTVTELTSKPERVNADCDDFCQGCPKCF